MTHHLLSCKIYPIRSSLSTLISPLHVLHTRFQYYWKNWTNMLDDVGPTRWLMLDQHCGWCWSNVLDDIGPTCLIYLSEPWRHIMVHILNLVFQWLWPTAFRTTVIPYINNLQTSTEQLVLNPLTHKWKSCASPKVTKTWHNLFKKRYCLSSNSAVTDFLKNASRKNY